MHCKKITTRKFGKQGKSTGSDWGNPHYKLVGSFKHLLPRQHWYLPQGIASYPNTAIRGCWKTLKLEIFEDIPVFSFLASIKEFGVFLSLSLWLKRSQHISGCRNHFHLPSTINLNWAVTNFPISPPDWLMGRSRCPSLYLSWQTALSVIYLHDKRGPSSCWRAQHEKGEPGIDRAVCLHLRTESAHPLLQLQGSN